MSQSALARKFQLEKRPKSRASSRVVDFIHEDISDLDLIRRLKMGDKTAFSLLVRRWQKTVYTQCFRQVGRKSIAEELVQDIFLAIYRSASNFREEAKFSTWLFRIVINHCKNKNQYGYRRKEKFHEPIEGSDPERPRELAAVSANPEELSHQASLKAAIQDGLANLDEKQRCILILRDIQGLSYDEIAEIIDTPKGTVKSRIHRARLSLAEKLKTQITLEDLED